VPSEIGAFFFFAKLEICDNKCRFLCLRSESFASYPPLPLGVLTALLKLRVCAIRLMFQHGEVTRSPGIRVFHHAT
jgi:hypothetical protein